MVNIAEGSRALATIAMASPSPKADQRIPIFDTHIHYSRAAWQSYGPARILEVLDAAGVPRALVSSTPDDGTLRLHAAARDRVVPLLRPYRSRADMADWFRNQDILDYVVARLDSGRYRGIGEFHLFEDGDAGTPQITRLARLAAARGLVLHVHAGAGPIRALFAMEPGLQILWAHAGMGAPPEAIGGLLAGYPGLTTELSFRAADIAPEGRLDPAWRGLFVRHADRFMIGTDTYVTARWDMYRDLVDEHRRWLAQLPADVAKAIAYGNAVREFGAGNRAAFED
ncbi:MAG: amidohydrolase family protein [Kiloniellaceae bacterium]